MGDINPKLEQMVTLKEQRVSTDEAIRSILGENVAAKTKEIRNMVQMIHTNINQLEEKYSGMDSKRAILQEIDEQCQADCQKQFQRISDLKYMAALTNLERCKGEGSPFTEDDFKKIHQAEQDIAKDATPKEVDALREELLSTLPEDNKEIEEIIEKVAADESWSSVLEKVKQQKSGITKETREDVTVMAAALFLSEHSEISAKEAAAVATVRVAESEGEKKLHYILMAIPISLSVTVVGSLLAFGAAMTGNAALYTLGCGTATVSGVILSLLSLLTAGIAAYQAAKKAIPYVKIAWEKCRPYVNKAASKVKMAVAYVIGVVANNVVYPAIHWVNNRAVPAIKEKVIHPLRRRLERLFAWISEKKEQIVEFIKEAAAPNPVEQEEEQEPEKKLVSLEEEQKEEECIFEG